MLAFIRTWYLGYINPSRFVAALSDKPAPQWGFYAQLVRALMDSLLLYLPLSLMGRIPPTPSYLPFISTDSYYTFLVFATPFVFTLQWLIGGGVIYAILKHSRYPVVFRQILNITGVVTLVVGSFIMLWDWSWMAIGGMNQYLLGISHLLIDIWFIALTTICLKKLMQVPVPLGVFVTLLSIAVAFPLAVIFMRSPL